jgi:hypothetical protein
MADNDNNLETTGTGTATPPAPTTDYEARFKGLQQTLNAKTNEWTTKFSQLESEREAAKQEADNARKEAAAQKRAAADLDAQLKQLAEERNSLNLKAATNERGLNRFKAIAKHGLVQDEEAGLLRSDLEGEDFEKYLEAFKGRLGQAGQGALDQAMKGAVPPVTGANVRQPAATKQDLMLQLDKAAREGDTRGYDVVYSQLLQMDQGKKEA